MLGWQGLWWLEEPEDFRTFPSSPEADLRLLAAGERVVGVPSFLGAACMLLAAGSVLTFWSAFGFPSRPLSWAIESVSGSAVMNISVYLADCVSAQVIMWISRISLARVRFLEFIPQWTNTAEFLNRTEAWPGLKVNWEGCRYFEKHWFNLRFWPELLILPANQTLFVYTFLRSLVQTDMQSFRDTQKPQHRLSMPLFSKCLLSTDLVPGTEQSVEEDRNVLECHYKVPQ